MTTDADLKRTNVFHAAGYNMPIIGYLSTHNPMLTAEWQVWVIIAIAVIGVLSIVITIWKTRKW